MNPKELNITVREMEVLRLLRRGLSTREIAERMEISFNTVETHRKKMLRKFKAKNTAEMMVKALNYS